MALEKAVAWLNAAKVEYIICIPATPAGTAAEVIKSAGMEKASISFEQAKQKRQIVNDFEKLTDYVNILENMKAGDTVTFRRGAHKEFEDTHTWGSFRSSVQAKARRMFGPDNHIFARISGDDERLEVLRAV
jgi:hypothetical protein